MVQEVRSIVFNNDECRSAIAGLLSLRVHGLRADHLVALEFTNEKGAVGATLQIVTGTKATHVLDAADLMSAMLLYCRKTRIPLSSRSEKQLNVVTGGLALTTSINWWAGAHRTNRRSEIQAPDLAVLRTV